MKQYGGTAWRGRIILLAALLGALWFFPGTADAATLYVAPSTGQFAIDEVFNVVIRVNSQGTAVNASEGILSFNPAQLQVQSITLTGSIFNLNVREPQFSNTAGTVRWTGVILNPGYNGAAGNLITVRFKGIARGTTTVTYNSGAVLANDGAGTNVLSGMSGGTYTIGLAASPTPTPVPSGSGAPVVTSPTHPDSLRCYSNNDPIFEWQLLAGVDAVSYLVNEKPTANPGNVSDGLASRAAYTDIEEGSSYFHLKFRSGSAWGSIAHFPFTVDTIFPNSFSIVREDSSDTTDPRPLLSFTTADTGCGLERYMMKIGEGEWFEVPESPEDTPFSLPLQSPGMRTVLVEAIDRAGNSTRATYELTVQPISGVVIESYPDKVPVGMEFNVAGSAPANVAIAVEAVLETSPFGRLIFSDRPEAVLTVMSDGAGRWSGLFRSLRPGLYHLTAMATDVRGATSLPSDPVYVRVGNPWGDMLLTALRLILLLLLMMLVSALVHCDDWRFWRPVGGLALAEHQENGKLQELARDIADELAILAKVVRHRPLYPEEKYLKSKLMQYQRTVRVLLKDSQTRLAKRT